MENAMHDDTLTDIKSLLEQFKIAYAKPHSEDVKLIILANYGELALDLLEKVVAEQAPKRKKSDGWPESWKREGYNQSVTVAIDALRRLAKHQATTVRSEFDPHQLRAIARDLELTRTELLG